MPIAGRLALLAGVALALISVAGCAPLGRLSPTHYWERTSLFQPNKYPAGEWNQTTVLVEDAYFGAADGTKLHGWYVRNPQPKAHALVMHGNAGNVTLMAETIRTLNHRHQLSVLALDYRGYGRSEGTPSEAGILQDARAARRWLAKKEGIAEQDVLLMGQSLGGGVAVDLAASDGARGLVLAGTFTSIPDVAQHHVSWLPMKRLLTTKMDSISKIKNYRGPLLLAHGDADEVIPYQQGLDLFNAAASTDKRMITNFGGKHNDPLPDEYRQALDQFIAKLPPLSTQQTAVATGEEIVTER
ncbi:Haloalkane dehalogenase [Anatilimnocola aggregata]|uniref:Haloalkane dehalogenase n=1 Tax=Anatilimnocola aggregata TaxID=2528021 RepID=A0A517YMR1_9BACT|nr:alpha/beta hydrolase [Anatilimnocola aggregata]QDU31503.1 Haloalkane dehalogenase [Anatilimnocola aggregata]